MALETALPEASVLQQDFTDIASRILGLTDAQAYLLKRITSSSEIKKRHTAIEGIFSGWDDATPLPKTAIRNQWYKEAAPVLAEAACRATLQAWGQEPEAITHIISVSCTGMMAPGIEFLLINRLGLSSRVERLGINFMGCFGAFKGLSMAKALAKENVHHRILVVCVELCSLHFQGDRQKDTLIANALFADGAAAVIVGAEPKGNEKVLLEMHSQISEALSGTTDLMSWEVGDQGYQMRLDASVPQYLQKHIAPFVKRLVGPERTLDMCDWAVHPGGKAILQAVMRGCQLEREEVAASWHVLQEYGNMSSPTFLFVLKELLRNIYQKRWVVGLGFGPGLSMEGLLLQRARHVAK